MKANTVGDLFRENVLREDYLFNSGEALETILPPLDHVDGFSLVICVADAEREFVATDTDEVVALTKTWTFANGGFGDGDVGASFTVTGSATNDGTYVIATVVDDETITSVGAPAGDETFDEDVSVTLTDDPVQVAADDITFEVSNDYVPERLPGLNQVPNSGHWADITDMFTDFSAITAAGCQYVQAYPLVARSGKLIITPTSGASLISIYYSAKGNR